MQWKDRAAGFAYGILAVGLVALIGGIAFAADDAQVMIDNFKFAPTPVTVASGSTVTWVNRDDISHSIVVPALGIRSGIMATNQSFVSRFDKPGTYDYVCGVHSFMRGKLVIQP